MTAASGLRRRRDLSAVGESGLIGWIRRRGGGRKSGSREFRLEQGIGDDAAVIECRSGGGRRLRMLVSSDLLIEGVHFDTSLVSPRDIGWKAAAVNISDMAAMGGRPLFLLLSLAAPGSTPWSWVRGFMQGLRSAAARFGATLIGGDTSDSPGGVFIDVAVIGETRRPVLRSGAKVGDAIFASRTLGDSAAGLIAMRQGIGKPRAIARHLRPMPEVELGVALAERNVASAMIDMSDGLSRDLRNLCRESRCGAVIDADALPISRDVHAICARAGSQAIDLALHGGEDYGLLFTVPRKKAEELKSLAGVHRIGQIVDRGYWLETGGKRRPLPDRSWAHFQARSSG